MFVDFTQGNSWELSLMLFCLHPSPFSMAAPGLISFCSSSIYSEAEEACPGCHLRSGKQFVRRVFNYKSISNSSEYLLCVFDRRGKCLSRKIWGFPLPSLRSLEFASNSRRLQKPSVQNRCIDSRRILLFVTCNSISRHDLACLLPCVKQKVQFSIVRRIL